MRDGLVPEHRADKNGRVQTKWVRPGPHAPAGMPPLPSAPSPQPPRTAADEDRDWTLGFLRNFAEEYGYDEDGFDDLTEQLEHVVGELDGRTGRFLVEVLMEHNGYEDVECLTQRTAAIVRDEDVTPETRATMVANLLHCVPERVEVEALELGDATFAATEVFDALSPAARQTPFTDAFGEACRALGAAARLRPEDGSGWVQPRGSLPLDDAEGVLRVLAEHPDHAAALAEAMVSRGRLDGATAREIAESGVLGDGAL